MRDRSLLLSSGLYRRHRNPTGSAISLAGSSAFAALPPVGNHTPPRSYNVIIGEVFFTVNTKI